MRRIILLGLTTAGLLALSSGLWMASARQIILSGKAADIGAERQALRQAREQAARARALSRQMDERAGTATAEADRLNAQAAALAARITESEADYRAGEARLAIASHLVADQAARLAAQQGPAMRLTAALQSLTRRPPAFMLLQPGSLTDTVHVRAALTHIWPTVRSRTAGLRSNLNHSRQLRATALQASHDLRAIQHQLTQRRSAFNRLAQEQRLAARGFTATALLEAERATAMEERARDIDALMEEVQRADEVLARLTPLPVPEPRPASGGGQEPRRPRAAAAPAYRLPVEGTLITGTGELSDSGLRARGITLAVRAGAPVIAPADGHIAFAGPYKGFGQILIIDHGGGWTSLITHLARLSVRPGEDVRQGASIGLAGQGANPVITAELRRHNRAMDIVAMATTSSL